MSEEKPLVIMLCEEMGYGNWELEDKILKTALTPKPFKIIHANLPELTPISTLPDEMCKDVEGLWVFRHWFSPAEIAKFPKLKVVIRMGVGYDRLDRKELDRRGVKVCNIPDYGTTEVADHAITMALTIRRGILMQHDVQRSANPEWAFRYLPPGAPNMKGQLVQRPQTRTFGIVGLGRIGTAAALRAKAFGWKVIFFDPFVRNGVDRSIGVEKVRTIEELFTRSDTVSLHTPLTKLTDGMVDARLLAMMPEGGVIVSTARGQSIDIEALYDAMKSGHIAGAGLDVLPVEPVPENAVPRLIAAYRAQEPWLSGRFVLTPHSAFFTPESWNDIRSLSAECMRDVLIDGLNTNVIDVNSE